MQQAMQQLKAVLRQAEGERIDAHEARALPIAAAGIVAGAV